MADQGYKNWALQMSGLNPNFASAVLPGQGEDYNYNLAYLSGIKPELNKDDGQVHLSDIGKMPNHPTFSNESAYAAIPSLQPNMPQPGQWVGFGDDWRYHNPSRGLVYANESQAYQPPTKEMLDLGRTVQALNTRDLARTSSY